SGSILKALDELGHGDTLVIADANFPAHTVGVAAQAPVIDVPGHPSPQVTSAVRTLLPIDTYEGPAVALMETEPGVSVKVQQQLIEAAEVSTERVEYLERFDFYEVAKQAALVIRTGERRPYGNIILGKGVVSP